MLIVTTDLTIILQDRPGTIADVGEALGKAGIDIDGICGFPCEGEGVLHILVEDAAAARSVIEQIGFEVRGERSVLVIECEDRIGLIGDITRSIADAGVNIDLIYVTPGTRLVIGADNLEKARVAVESHV